ncbi:hypothetical protein ACFLVW_04070, partial [Chloroflexota bacterium]
MSEQTGSYEIIGKLPLLRKRFGLYRNEITGKLSFGRYFRRVDGFAVGVRETATTNEEAKQKAAEMLASGRGFISVVIQNLDKTDDGALELWVE